MAEHVWLAREDNRPGCRCTNCGLVAREPHQGWECPGEDDQKPIQNTTDLAKRYAQIMDAAANALGCQPDRLFDFAVAARERVKQLEHDLQEADAESKRRGDEIARQVKNAADLHERIESLKAIVEPLNRLRANEGASVEILCDNPEGPPRCTIRVSDDWTGEAWDYARFDGDSLAECLKKALEAKVAAEKGAQG